MAISLSSPILSSNRRVLCPGGCQCVVRPGQRCPCGCPEPPDPETAELLRLERNAGVPEAQPSAPARCRHDLPTSWCATCTADKHGYVWSGPLAKNSNDDNYADFVYLPKIKGAPARWPSSTAPRRYEVMHPADRAELTTEPVNYRDRLEDAPEGATLADQVYRKGGYRQSHEPRGNWHRW